MPIYMKYGKIQGKSKGRYKDWIELTSCQLGNIRNAPSNSGVSRPSPTVSEIVVTKPQDCTSTDLFRQSMWGEGVHAEIEFAKPGALGPYLHLDLEDSLISSYNTSRGSNGPEESFSINCKRIEFKVV